MMLQQLLLFATPYAAQSGCEKQFFGLTPWYAYLPASDFQGCDIHDFTFFPTSSTSLGDVPLVLLAVVDDLLRIAGIVAVGFVVYGAVQYIASQGSPDATSKAQSTIINALLGLAIAVLATAFVAFLGNKLGG
ncbi:MAG TPA: hypothetical protein VIJ68_01455 [Candidatus Saccharimonadales bacterium]